MASINIGSGNIVGGDSVIIISGRVVSSGGGNTVKGSGNVVKDFRDVSSFDSIVLSAPVEVFLNQGSEESLIIEGDDNIVALLKTSVERGVLRIKFPDNTSVSFDKLLIKVEAKDICALSIEGAGTLNAADIKTPTLKNKIAGSGNIELSDCNTQELSIVVAGSGDVDTSALEAEEVSVQISGSGDAFVHANRSLNAQVAGSGDVRYKGTPEVQKNIAGSGSIKPKKGF